jgi:thioredoxin reductase
MEHDIKDITVIGAGPAGLFALFYAGMRGASAQIVDALPEVGGQLTALYPEKLIFDVAGHPKVLAKELVRSLRDQAAQFGEPVHLGQAVIGLEEEDGHFVLETTRGRFPTRSIVIAAGIGAFSPRRLPQACAEPWYERGIYDVVSDPSQFRGQRVVIVGGGDSAFDWATQLRGVATHVSLVHRSDRFRAHGATVTQLEADVAAGAASMFTFHELADVVCKREGAQFSHLVLKQVKTKELTEIEADVVLPMLGFVSSW